MEGFLKRMLKNKYVPLMIGICVWLIGFLFDYMARNHQVGESYGVFSPFVGILLLLAVMSGILALVASVIAFFCYYEVKHNIAYLVLSVVLNIGYFVLYSRFVLHEFMYR